MKARVIATGKIVDVVANGNYYDTTDNKERYYSYELDFNDTTDYWARLASVCRNSDAGTYEHSSADRWYKGAV